MYFASDNAGPAHPEVMAALMKANQGYAASYGKDDLMAEVRTRIREVFEAPEACVYLTLTGSSANSLALATLCQPWQTIYCAPTAHIEVDECNAPEFFTGGAKLTLVGGDCGKIGADALRAAIAAGPDDDPHQAQRGPVSITQVTERGTLYTLAEIAALTDVAHEYGQPVHMDGARFSNALVALGCTPAEMTWKAGIDAVSFGGTKNGLLGAEAVIFFDPRHAWEFELRRKRAGHLISKHRYLSAQLLAYLTDDLWLRMARAANAAAQKVAAGIAALPEASFICPPQANMIFADLPASLHRRLIAAGVRYETHGNPETAPDSEPMGCRMVCDWSLSDDNIERFLSLLRG